ncbi:MAG: hypothetical protein JWQ49_4532 [Edaphobacter sp.]|nr:hypothetical protein [Edaphobacter sp.]
MLSKPTPPSQEALDRKTRYQTLVLVCCLLFGFAMIANMQSAADGGWFWYAVFWGSGKRLYSDMHLVLQPLFVLETASFLALFGKGWLVSKIPALLHLVAYCFGLFLLARQSRLPDRQKALILGCAFFLSVAFEAYRFDDYHVLTDCFELYSILALLWLQKSVQAAQRIGLVAGLGVLSGLALTTRLNDGAALVVGVALGILCLAPSRKLILIVIFGLISILTAALIVHFTGDSFNDYATYSIFRAAGSKGGTSNVLLGPLLLPWNALRALKVHWYVALNLYGIGVAAGWLLLLRWSVTAGQRRRLIRLIVLAVILLFPLRIHHMYRGLFSSDFIIALTAIAIPAAYLLGALVFARFIRWLLVPGAADWNRAEILLLLPLGHLASASMSSAGHPEGLYQPLAVLMLLLPLASPIHVRKESTRAFMLAIVALLACSCAVYKVRTPYKWHSYRSAPMFAERQWYRHPVYGPMIIETAQLKVFTEICSQIGTDSRVELLSLPLTYANYFCSIAPWHGYVQTFFDTSSKETIFGLMEQLEKAPPKWVLYQRQLDILAMHEDVFNHGKPLPHRYLDQMIEQKLDRGGWEKVYSSNYEDSPGWRNEWILIRTRP